MLTMKKVILPIFCLLLMAQDLTGTQTKKPAAIEDNLYLRGLTTYLQSAVKEFEGIKTKRDYYHLIVEKNIDITEGLPTQLGEHKISYKNQTELLDQSMKEKAEIPITIIRPIKNEGTKLILSFSEYWVSHKNKRMIYSLEGGCKIEIAFDKTTGDFVIGNIKFLGV
jgi:hypothetical protein